MNSHMATAMLAKSKEYHVKFRLWSLEPPSPVIERRRLRTRRQNQAPNQSTPFYQPSGPREFSCIDGHCNSLFVVGRLCVRTSLSGIIRFGSAISSRFFASSCPSIAFLYFALRCETIPCYTIELHTFSYLPIPSRAFS